HLLIPPHPPIPTLFPYTTLFRSPTKTPPTSTLGSTLTTSSVQITFNPPLSIVKNQITALLMDFDMRRSFELDSKGQLTGKVTPVDRKSTRLNSSHRTISYAVFCL